MVTMQDMMSFLITLRDQRAHMLGDLQVSSYHLSKYPETAYSTIEDITSTIEDVSTILGLMYADFREKIENEVKNEQQA